MERINKLLNRMYEIVFLAYMCGVIDDETKESISCELDNINVFDYKRGGQTSELKPCPFCGRDMDKRSEADKDNEGHGWYRDDSDYIKNLIRSNKFLKGTIAQMGGINE